MRSCLMGAEFLFRWMKKFGNSGDGYTALQMHLMPLKILFFTIFLYYSFFSSQFHFFFIFFLIFLSKILSPFFFYLVC